MSDDIINSVNICELNKPNKNGRIYTYSAFKDVIGKSFYGSIGMPKECCELNLATVSHVVENIRIEDDMLIGDVKILKTPEGKNLKELVDNVVFRLAGTGILTREKIVDDYKLISINAVNIDDGA